MKICLSCPPRDKIISQSDILAHKNKRCWTTHKLLSQILQMGKLVSTYLNIKKIVKIIIGKRGTNRSML